MEYVGKDFKSDQASATDMGRILDRLQVHVLLIKKYVIVIESNANIEEGNHVC